jgi:hypothetical protein
MIGHQNTAMKEQELVNQMRLKLRQILISRQDITFLACQQRVKFEGWLKFELAGALNRDPNIEDILLEGGYTAGGRADVVFTYYGITWFVEMKTSNTNWRAEGIQNRTRPIKKNIDEIIQDIKILQEFCYPHNGLSVFVLFPLALRIWKDENARVTYHLQRIESECGLKDGSLIQEADYIDMNNQFGVCSFIVSILH